VNMAQGATDLAALAEALDGDTACLVIQTPNFFGNSGAADQICQMASAAGVLSVVSIDPISMGVSHEAGE